jgi:hypothetical protein
MCAALLPPGVNSMAVKNIQTNSNIPATVQMLQFQTNVAACYKRYVPCSLSVPFPGDKHNTAATKSVLCQCGEMSKCSQKPLRALNFIRRTVGGGIRDAGTTSPTQAATRAMTAFLRLQSSAVSTAVDTAAYRGSQFCVSTDCCV